MRRAAAAPCPLRAQCRAVQPPSRVWGGASGGSRRRGCARGHAHAAPPLPPRASPRPSPPRPWPPHEAPYAAALPRAQLAASRALQRRLASALSGPWRSGAPPSRIRRPL
eukprot:scaffold14003_cov35-Tisochrysis_lutea.AAC.3